MLEKIQYLQMASQDHFPLTVEQLHDATEKLATMETNALEFVDLLTAAYGSNDLAAVRSYELLAAIQRLAWILNPAKEKKAALQVD